MIKDVSKAEVGDNTVEKKAILSYTVIRIRTT
jgi:hypothetical protein